MAERAAREDGLAPAELCDARFLVGTRPPIDRFGIDDVPKIVEAVADQALVAGIAAPVVALLRIASQVEQHRRHADVIDEFERSMTGHERARHATGRVVLAKHRARWRRFP